MNVLFIGDKLLAERLSSALVNNIKITHLLDLPFALSLIKKQTFDLVIVDYLVDGVANICDQICGLACTPLALILREKEANWKSLYDIEVDGFLAEESSDAEMLARINSLSRRNVLRKKVKPV